LAKVVVSEKMAHDDQTWGRVMNESVSDLIPFQKLACDGCVVENLKILEVLLLVVLDSSLGKREIWMIAFVVVVLARERENE
jgi:hypothetical protein